MSKQAATN